MNKELIKVIEDCGLEAADVKTILDAHLRLISQGLIITDIDGNTIDFNIEEGVIELPFSDPSRTDCVDVNKIKSAAVMEFANTIRGAYCSGFVSNDFTVYDVYRAARNHVKDKYCLFTPAWDDEYAKQSNKTISSAVLQS